MLVVWYIKHLQLILQVLCKWFYTGAQC